MTTQFGNPDTTNWRERLLQRRAALHAALVDGTRAQYNTLLAPPTAEVHDSKDDAFADLTRNLRGADLAHVRDELGAIDGALRRVEMRTYGTCSGCGHNIGLERLMAQPSAERCLMCQERVELGQL